MISRVSECERMMCINVERYWWCVMCDVVRRSCGRGLSSRGGRSSRRGQNPRRQRSLHRYATTTTTTPARTYRIALLILTPLLTQCYDVWLSRSRSPQPHLVQPRFPVLSILLSLSVLVLVEQSASSSSIRLQDASSEMVFTGKDNDVKENVGGGG